MWRIAYYFKTPPITRKTIPGAIRQTRGVKDKGGQKATAVKGALGGSKQLGSPQIDLLYGVRSAVGFLDCLLAELFIQRRYHSAT